MKKQSVYNWNMVFFLTIIPLIGIFGTSIYVYHYGMVWQEPIFLLVLWFLSGMGITMGYHRLFAHKSFKTNIFSLLNIPLSTKIFLVSLVGQKIL